MARGKRQEHPNQTLLSEASLIAHRDRLADDERLQEAYWQRRFADSFGTLAYWHSLPDEKQARYRTLAVEICAVLGTVDGRLDGRERCDWWTEVLKQRFGFGFWSLSKRWKSQVYEQVAREVALVRDMPLELAKYHSDEAVAELAATAISPRARSRPSELAGD